MKYLILSLIFLLTVCSSVATTPIRIFSPYSPGHSATPAMLRIIDQSNQTQNTYRFSMEYKPGGNQVIAVKNLDENSLAMIAPAFVENLAQGKLVEKDYVPIWSLGDACWAVATNKPLENAGEFVVGGVGLGNASHLTALALGERYGFDVRYVLFKSNNDALVNMVGNNGVEFVIERLDNIQALQTKNLQLRVVVASCPVRLPQAPSLPTLQQMNIVAPYIFNIAVAQRTMPLTRQRAIAEILDSATRQVGATTIYSLSAMRPPIFDNISTEDHYNNSVLLLKKLQKKYRIKIDQAW